MSQYDSQNTLNRRSDLTAGGSIRYSRREFVHGGGNGYNSMERYNTFSKSSVGGLPLDPGGTAGAIKGGLSGVNDIHQRAASLQAQCQEDLRRAEFALQSGDSTADAERYMLRAKGTIDHLKNYAMDLRQMGQPHDNVVKSWEVCNDQLKGVHLAMTGSMQRRRSAKGSSGSWEEPGRSFHDAVAWITQQKHLIGTSSWGEDPLGIEKHLILHQRFHNSIQNSPEVERARNDLGKKGDKGNLHALEQEWDSLQKMSFGRLQQLEDLQQIIQEMSKEIMWVNDKEEEELIFDWGEKNIDQYIPKKQESYSKLMSALEEKEKHLNKLKVRVDTLLKNNHPASDKIEAYRDTLQTQWSWLLQITKCMDVHLKENAAYNQFFKEANETYRSLQTEQETLRKKFNRDKNTSLDNLLELLMELEREREKIMDHKRQVQHLVNKAKTIVRLKPRNPEEKSSTPVIVKALCDFKQDQKVICKGDEAILKGNSQRSKWEVTGPGGLDMTVPSVCLIIPPPNPLSIGLATKNEQYFESILSLWNQLYINIKSLIAWQYCLVDIDNINLLTISMLASMQPEEYRKLIKSLETHYEEFKLSCQGSQMFADDDKRSIESQFNGAQTHYETLVVQLPTYNAQQVFEQPQQQLFFVQLAAEEDTRDFEEEQLRAEKKVKVTKTEKKKVVSSSRSLTELLTLRLKLESAEGLLSQHIHVCFGDDGAKDCSLKIIQLEDLQHDVSLIREEYLRLREHIMKELESMSDSDKAAFLQSELGVINQRLNSLESSSSAYFQRLEALRNLLQSMAWTEDIVKVHEARLTEQETTSLLPRDVNDYMRTLKSNREELDQKIDVLASMEAELANAKLWNEEVGGPFHRCDIMLSKYAEQVDLLSDRWKRIQTQMDNRLQDLQRYLPQLEHFKQTSHSLSDWIDNTRKKQDILRTTKIQTVEVLKDHIKNEKALNADIKAERSTVESVLKDSDASVNSIKEYETDLACYASGLETLLNIPIKKTMLRSPSMDLTQEATQLQTRYLELLTLSDGYLKFLGELLKNMEELKIRSTRIDLLEEELCMLREDIQDRNAKNKSLEDAVSRYQLELSQSNEKLLSVEEIKRTTALQCSDTKDSLDTTQNQLADLSDQVTRLNFLLEEERRRRKLAEERYSQQKEEYDSVLKKRQTELENVSWSKMEVENSMANKDREIEQLRQKLAAETSRGADLQKEILKTSTTMQLRESQYGEIVKERDALLLKLQLAETEKNDLQSQGEDLRRIRLSHESELQNKHRLQEENDRLKRDLSYWKEQYETKQNLARQYDADKEHMEKEINTLKSEIQRLLRELSDIEETYKRKLLILQKELTELTVVRQTMQDELTRAREPPTLDPSTVIFDGIRKPVTAAQLLDCGALDQSTFNQLIKGQMTVHEASLDKKVILKGTGPIAGVIIENPEGDRSISGFPYKITLTEAKKECLLPAHVVDLLLDAQVATGHIIDPRTNQKLTVEEACHQGIIDEEDRQRLKATEAAVVGYRGPATNKPLSVFQAMKKGLVDKTTTLRLLQAQESVGGILDPTLSVFLPKDTAIERKLIDNDMYCILNQKPELYSDPDSETDVTYFALKRKCKVDPHTGLLLLSVLRKLDPSKIVFDALRKPVTAKQLLDCGILDKSTFKELEKGKATVQEVSVDKHINLKGSGPIAGIIAGIKGKMSLSEAKRHNLLSHDCADLLLEAQAATGHVIDPITNTKLTVEEAVAARVVDTNDRERLLAAQAAAVGYKDASAGHPLSVYGAMKKGLIDKKMGIRLLQAQECVGGILDPNLSVFLPKDIAISRNILDVNVCNALNQNPKCYLDAENEQDVSYGDLRKRCKTEAHTGLLLLPITERKDPSKLIFDGVRKPVTARQLHDCGILDTPLFTKLTKGEKTVPQVSDEKRVFLKGLGSIAGVSVGSLGIMSLSEAKKQLLISKDCADLLLDAQAATGHIIDPRTNQRFTVEEACARGVVDRRDRDRLLAAESAAVGYRDPSTSESLSVFEAMNRGIIDSKTGLRLLQAQESAGGVIDPNTSVFFPKDIALKRNLLNKDLFKALNQSTACYLDPDTECEVCYEALKKKCKTQFNTGLIILPVVGRKDPSKLMFDGVRKPVSAKQLFECGVIDKSTLDDLVRGEKTVSEVSAEKNVYLKGNGPIAGVAGHKGKMSLLEAKKQCLLSPETADLLMEAQAATGYIIDPSTYQKLTVEEACAKGVVDIKYKDKLLVAEAAAVGYKDPSMTKPLSVYEAIKNGLIDRKTGLRFLQAQECVGGILDPGLSVFLPIDMAIKRNLIDADLCHALNQYPAFYLNPDPELDVSYGVLKQRCETEHHTGLKMLPISEKIDPSKLIFDGVRKSITAKQLFDCGILDKPTLNQLITGEKTVPEVSAEKNVFLKGTGVIAGVAVGSSRNISFTQAKKENIMSADSADLLLEAQAATGHVIDPRTNQKMTVKEACTRGLVSKEDESKLFAAEAAAIGYRDPNTSRLLSAGQAMKKGLIDKDTALRILQVQECTGGILDPTLSIYLPRDIAMDRSLIDADLYEALGQYPECFLDPDTQLKISYLSLKEKCRKDQGTGLLLLPEPKKPKTVQGLRDKVSVIDLLHAQLLEPSDIEELKEGRLRIQDIEYRLRSYLGASTCIAGVYDEASDKVMTFYKAMQDGLMQPGTTLKLLEAQAATGFVVDPVNNTHLTVSDAYNKGLFGPEFKDNMILAEKAVTGYKRSGTNKVISLFQAMEFGLVEKAHGIRMLEAQIASGGIIDPEHSHRIDVNVAHLRGYIDEKMKKILTDQDEDTKGFIDPNTEEKLTYTELKKRCITDKKTGLIVLPIADKIKQDASIKNTTRERRILIVDPETNKEMTVREAYNKGYIDYTTFMELSQQECEWEEITTTSPDGAKRFVIIDRKTGREYDINELLEKGVIDHSVFHQYQSRIITLTQFADIITEKTEHNIFPPTTASVPSSMSSSSTVSRNAVSPSKMTATIPQTIQEQSSATKSVARDSTKTAKQMSSISIKLASPVESVSERDPVGAIFDTETLEKISITEAIKRGLVDNITGLRLLEAQSCTGGIINPANGHRIGIQEASRLGIINDDMATKLKPAQKAFFGFEDVKTGTKMSVAEAIKEMWVPYEAGQRFMEFQFVTGGLYDPELGCRRSIADALKIGWINDRTATKLQDISHHTKILTCPKSKLKMSYQEALDNCLVEESTGVKMLQASSVSSRGISSPYNVGSAPGSSTGSRTGSQRSSRRNSLDLGSPTNVVTSHHSHTRLTSVTTRSEKNQK
ncbi:desmoplakin-A-like isoform X2 [Nerophis ophidion]|uniref:desmoplakin-A-like isoform X2 n=1 Tax=Nerophis ophidion TaxID=159077 RepID=UPI002ADF8637|nr:desmoplakin-A-like isoform X2 [Nerophis ophidion]